MLTALAEAAAEFHSAFALDLVQYRLACTTIETRVVVARRAIERNNTFDSGCVLGQVLDVTLVDVELKNIRIGVCGIGKICRIGGRVDFLYIYSIYSLYKRLFSIEFGPKEVKAGQNFTLNKRRLKPPIFLLFRGMLFQQYV